MRHGNARIGTAKKSQVLIVDDRANFVVMGGLTAPAWSMDGINWTNGTMSASPLYPMVGCIWGNNTFVALANTNTTTGLSTMISYDGKHWDLIARGPNGNLTTLSPERMCWVPALNIFVIITGNSSSIAYSPTALSGTWSAGTVPSGVFTVSNSAIRLFPTQNGVALFNSEFLGVTRVYHCTSPTLSSWTLVATLNNNTGTGGQVRVANNDSNSYLTVDARAANQGFTYSSTDAVTWTSKTSMPIGFTGGGSTYYLDYMKHVNRYVAVKDGTTAYTDDLGTTWTIGSGSVSLGNNSARTAYSTRAQKLVRIRTNVNDTYQETVDGITWVPRVMNHNWPGNMTVIVGR